MSEYEKNTSDTEAPRVAHPTAALESMVWMSFKVTRMVYLEVIQMSFFHLFHEFYVVSPLQMARKYNK